MSTYFNPYGKKTHNHDYGIYFNLFYYYIEKFKQHPFVYEYGMPIKRASFENLQKLGAKEVFACDLEKFSNEEIVVNNMESCYEYEDCLIFFFRKESLLSKIDLMQDRDGEFGERIEEKDFAIYRCRVLYQKKESLEKVKEQIKVDKQHKKHSNVYLLCTMDGMLGLQRFDIKLPSKEIDLELNYGKSAAEKFNKIIQNLNKNKNGLVLFSGDPGTGKSTFIKYLTTKTERKVIYLSSSAVEQLTNPDFLSFIMSHRNSILLLEDAEKVLRSRESQDNEAVSNILNITDGILGDCLNIMVIATFNIDRENIDSALVRKGRLLMEHHFKALSADDCNKIFEKIGCDRRTTESITLAEIYNSDDNFHEKEEKKKVGF